MRMRLRRGGLRLSLLAMLVGSVMLTLLVGSPAAAPDTLTFDAGIACSFPLQIDRTGGKRVTKTFTAADGTVRVLSAGKGFDLLFTNLATGATYALKGSGSVSWTRVDTSAGTARLTFSGHNVVIYFPTDVPAGPSTTLVVGTEVVAVNSSGNWTRLARNGTTTDICAALS